MTPGVNITMAMPASAEQVFAWLTQPEYFSAWFGGSAVEVPLDRCTLDVRPGGAWHAVMILPDGEEISWDGDYLTVEAPGELVFTITDQPGDERDTVAVTVIDRGEGSEITLQQFGGGLSEAQYADAAAGWRMFLEAMAKLAHRD